MEKLAAGPAGPLPTPPKPYNPGLDVISRLAPASVPEFAIVYPASSRQGRRLYSRCAAVIRSLIGMARFRLDVLRPMELSIQIGFAQTEHGGATVGAASGFIDQIALDKERLNLL